MVDVGLLHHLEELAGIGRQRLDVAPLPLGIDGVEGERGLARARQAGDHRQRLARNIDVDILEIVLARAADGNVGKHRLPVPDLFLLPKDPPGVNAAQSGNGCGRREGKPFLPDLAGEGDRRRTGEG